MIVTTEYQTEICELIRESTKVMHEVAVGRLMSNPVYNATSELITALFAAHDGSESALLRAAFHFGRLVELVPSRATEYRVMYGMLASARDAAI